MDLHGGLFASHTDPLPAPQVFAGESGGDLNYELFFTYATDMFLVAGLDGYFKRLNPAFCNLLDRSEAELIARPLLDWIHPADASRVEAAFANLRLGLPAFLVEIRVQAADDTYYPLLWSAYPDPATGLIFIVARRYAGSVSESERVRSLMDSSPTAVFMVEQDGLISYSNPLADAIFGYERNELIGCSIETLIPTRLRGIHEQERNGYARKPVLRPIGAVHNLVGLRKNGEEFPVEVGLNPIWLDRGTTIICSVLDASAQRGYLDSLVEQTRKLSEENLRLGQLADRDALTGLFNRRAFERIFLENLSAAREKQDLISILFVDLDRFKEVNDAFGHAAGDTFLRRAGALLGHNVRREDTVARVGGEEFVVVLPGLGREQAAAFGERLRGVFERADWGARPLTISLGAATYQFESRRAGLRRIMKQMIAQADQAMYRSKQTGRNRFVHFGELLQAARSTHDPRGSQPQPGDGAN